MKNFKVVFPSGYNIIDEINDNIDINVVLKDGQVYFATVFTIKNIEFLMEKNKLKFFWADSMIISDIIDKNNLKNTISNIIEDGLFNSILTRIGSINDIYGNSVDYESIVDFCNGFEIKIKGDS